ncbi:ankyrin repeat-containing domain protein [Aspergillus karnatakaensis]|uniref:ankyrin repeat-containing domain protein n=1 Tax=Aspergillus karnatakaensis TaxID=1810916 RepID=UPI003CCE2C0B
MLDSNTYTVGWICATRVDYTAARAFLDEVHEVLNSASSSSSNHYTLGKLGRHHVVMAVLPAGGYGVCSAAIVARDLVHDFPNIKIGLMVWVGGAAPSRKHDIRLGDIVVSRPHRGTGGVIQLDLGKEIQDQEFIQTSFLNKPPVGLLTAMNGLATIYQSEGHQIEASISRVLAANPSLQKVYEGPAPATDRLYRSDVVHPIQSDASCEKACGNDPSVLIVRPQRKEYDDDPMVHYGVIASSNRLMKNALTRDKLAHEKGVLCFEMEAAGLVNHFPCLNDEWQGYAAMTAAAYTRDLLREIRPAKVAAQRNITEILENVSKGIRSLVDTHEDQKLQAVIKWLGGIDSSSQQRDYLELRQEEFCQWLLASDQFQQWLINVGRTLFCPGIPGAGKSIATSIVVDHLYRMFENDPGVAVAYIFYSYTQPGTTKLELYSSLLRQLARPPTPNSILQLYDSYSTKGIRPSSDTLLRTLKLAISEYSRVFIVVDALDECSISESVRINIAAQLTALQAETYVNMFATSRYSTKMAEIFENAGGTIMDIRARDEDIQNFLRSHIPDTPPFDSPGIKQEIMHTIFRETDGMFLLARLHLDSLRDKDTPMKVDEALESIPNDSEVYSEVYEQAMRRIEGSQKGAQDLALQVLAWITLSPAAITIGELQHGLAVIPGSSKLNWRNLTDPRWLIDVCAGLVTLDGRSAVIRFVHHTAQKYFEQFWRMWFPDGHYCITTACLTYLQFEPFAKGPARSDTEYAQRLKENCLYAYAAQHWSYHAQQSYRETKEFIVEFLGEDLALASAIQVCRQRSRAAGPLIVPEKITGLHTAAYCGFPGETPLHWATRGCEIRTVELLLQKGMDVNATDLRMRSCLHCAAIQDSGPLITFLVESGALLELRDEDGRTPLLIAAYEGSLTSINQLLLNGAEIHALDGMRRNALHLAFLSNKTQSTASVKLLLERGMDINTCDMNNMTPLLYAVASNSRENHPGRIVYNEGEHAKTTERPREEVPGFDGLTPLHFAALIGRDEMAEYLLLRGADPNDANGYPVHSGDEWPGYRREKENSATSYSEDGNIDVEDYDEKEQLTIIEALLASLCIDTNIQNIELDTPLHCLPYESRNAGTIYKKLYRAGAVPGMVNGKGQTALHIASQANVPDIVTDTLERGCCIELEDGQSLNALHYAVRGSSYDTVTVMLRYYEKTRGSLKGAVDSQGKSLLHHHLEAERFRCFPETICLLSNYGVDANTIAMDGETPISLFLRKPYRAPRSQVCSILLQHGADPFWRSSTGQSLAHLALCSHWDQVPTLETLRNHGVDLAATDRNIGKGNSGLDFGRKPPISGRFER